MIEIKNFYTGAVIKTVASDDLTGMDLGGVDLGGVDLGGADLGSQWIIQGPTRSDGYVFFLQRLKDDTEPMIKAGCRYKTVAKAREHWLAEDYRDASLAAESLAIIDCLVKLAEIREYTKRSEELRK